ncbi:hypothetical protein [Arthrobacter koreensis]|uniref:hypothetical protein n=1 Tax=Arthrobacter koreensis TaxID=199136 RepID=UPI002DBC04F6|nr:hypothetical protein [Arthrobacter koreensis]MEB7448728.1 hypothetical protein [Arthrobacter koreensis]
MTSTAPGSANTRPVPTSAGARTLQPGAAIAFIVLGAGLWWGWFAWDTVRDGSGSESSGPYESWQVAGCAVTWMVLAWMGVKVLRPLLLIPALPVGFTAAWMLTAASAMTPDCGPWAPSWWPAEPSPGMPSWCGCCDS